MHIHAVQKKIHEIRNQKIMLDFDLAELYKVENRTLKQAVRRNMNRFRDDFMFQLTKTEWLEVITNCDNLPDTLKFSPSEPFAFTEQGVAMLSSILKSKKALQINISIMRAFILLRQFSLTNKELTRKLNELENRYDKKFNTIFEAIDYLLKKDKIDTAQKKRKRIGYK